MRRWLLLSLFLASPRLGEAQDPLDLIATGRFEAAVAALAHAEESEAEAAALAIIEEVKRATGFQREDWLYVVRGAEAAKLLPNLTQATLQDLNFWHGLGVHRVATIEQVPQTVETAQSTLPAFRDALDLLLSAGGFPEPFNASQEDLLDNVRTYIRIQEAVIRRGR